jgi:eukaryotic-like serine/threonine-protein kinase
MVDRLIGGRYRMLERHAVGGMATLWRARDERTGELVALKRLHPYLVADPRARERLVREMAALNAVDHPAITRPREVIDDPDDPALVMEFAEGRSLRERLEAEGPIAPEEAVAIAGTVADALAVAHDAGIVHRDIKPANILVEDSGAVHLVDFGIATLGNDDDAALTATGTMVGTVRYAAPERLSGGESTPQSDVWGLGAVLYEMLTGRPAVGADAAAALTSGAHDRLLEIASLPPALAAIVRRAMAPAPADRYQDAAAFRDALLTSDLSVDPFAETAVVPLAPTLDGPRPQQARRGLLVGLSSVDRAAAVFFGGVGAITLAVLVALGVGSAGQAASPSEPPPASVQVPPSPIDAVVTPSPDGGNGNGNGNGKGKGNGNNGEGD